MSTTGCHNCNVDLSKFKDAPWEKVPCSSCVLSKDYDRSFSTGYFDTVADEAPSECESPCLEEHDFVYKLNEDFKLTESDVKSLETIKSAVETQVMSVLGDVIVRMIKFAKKNPRMFEILIKKMQFPYMSYAAIGSTMNPKQCKQSVLYYLKRAVAEFPELESALLVDTRSSKGHYALKSVAAKSREKSANLRMRKLLYAQDPEDIEKQVKEINGILKTELCIPDAVLDYNPVIDGIPESEEMEGSDD
jgi:hypothetical protein